MSASVVPTLLPTHLLAPQAPSEPAALPAASTDDTPELADEAAGAAQLQIGDFVLGDMDCPSLTGHPDIRY